MPLRWPTLANVAALYLMTFTLLCLLQPALADDRAISTPSHPSNDSSDHLLCSPFGACEPCPSDAMNKPYCQPFGNRRLVHCVNATLPSDPNSNSPPGAPPKAPTDHESHPEGEILAWESCGRIVASERADFYEFIACNVVFALFALCILFFRSRRLQLMHARQLAARIGLIRGDGVNGRVVRP